MATGPKFLSADAYTTESSFRILSNNFFQSAEAQIASLKTKAKKGPRNQTGQGKAGRGGRGAAGRGAAGRKNEGRGNGGRGGGRGHGPAKNSTRGGPGKTAANARANPSAGRGGRGSATGGGSKSKPGRHFAKPAGRNGRSLKASTRN